VYIFLGMELKVYVLGLRVSGMRALGIARVLGL
jgi:hypothetical protein